MHLPVGAIEGFVSDDEYQLSSYQILTEVSAPPCTACSCQQYSPYGGDQNGFAPLFSIAGVSTGPPSASLSPRASSSPVAIATEHPGRLVAGPAGSSSSSANGLDGASIIALTFAAVAVVLAACFVYRAKRRPAPAVMSGVGPGAAPSQPPSSRPSQPQQEALGS